MDRIFSVNDVVTALDQFHCRTVRIGGALALEFEGDSIWHLPKRERAPGFGLSLWASFDHAALSLGEEQLKQFARRTVVVTVTVDCGFNGHLGAWPASILVTAIAKA